MSDTDLCVWIVSSWSRHQSNSSSVSRTSLDFSSSAKCNQNWAYTQTVFHDWLPCSWPLDDGLILRPARHFNIDCYVDAEFAGLWPLEYKLDPTRVKSHTMFVICISDCPLVWSSKLQSDIAMSMIEAEYTVLSTAMKDIIPIRTFDKTTFGLFSKALWIFLIS